MIEFRDDRRSEKIDNPRKSRFSHEICEFMQRFCAISACLDGCHRLQLHSPARVTLKITKINFFIISIYFLLETSARHMTTESEQKYTFEGRVNTIKKIYETMTDWLRLKYRANSATACCSFSFLYDVESHLHVVAFDSIEVSC